MNMPGMDMGSMQMGQAGKPSQVPGHAEVVLPSEVQQRIRVLFGWTMPNVRTVIGYLPRPAEGSRIEPLPASENSPGRSPARGTDQASRVRAR